MPTPSSPEAVGLAFRDKAGCSAEGVKRLRRVCIFFVGSRRADRGPCTREVWPQKRRLCGRQTHRPPGRVLKMEEGTTTQGTEVASRSRKSQTQTPPSQGCRRRDCHPHFTVLTSAREGDGTRLVSSGGGSGTGMCPCPRVPFSTCALRPRHGTSSADGAGTGTRPC